MNDSPHWARKYIGFPFAAGGRGSEGVDCWGLVLLVYRREFGIPLPSLPGISAATVRSIHSKIREEAERDWVELTSPTEGCVVAMSQMQAVHHVGVWTQADGGRIIHSWKRQNVVADSLKSIRLKGIRTVRYYQHREWKH